MEDKIYNGESIDVYITNNAVPVKEWKYDD